MSAENAPGEPVEKVQYAGGKCDIEQSELSADETELSANEASGSSDRGVEPNNASHMDVTRRRLHRRESTVPGPLGTLQGYELDTADGMSLDVDHGSATATRRRSNSADIEMACNVHALLAQVKELNDMVCAISKKQDTMAQQLRSVSTDHRHGKPQRDERSGSVHNSPPNSPSQPIQVLSMAPNADADSVDCLQEFEKSRRSLHVALRDQDSVAENVLDSSAASGNNGQAHKLRQGTKVPRRRGTFVRMSAALFKSKKARAVAPDEESNEAPAPGDTTARAARNDSIDETSDDAITTFRRVEMMANKWHAARKRGQKNKRSSGWFVNSNGVGATVVRRLLGANKEMMQEDSDGRVRLDRTLIVKPESTPVMCLNVIVLLICMFYVIAVPLYLAFIKPLKSSPGAARAIKSLQNVDVLLSMVLILKIIVGFFTAVKIEGRFVSSLSVIARWRLTHTFLLDIIAAVPLLTVDGLEWTKMFCLIRLFMTFNTLQEQLASSVHPSFVMAFRVVMLVMLAWHFVACSFWSIAVQDASENAAVINQVTMNSGGGASDEFTEWIPKLEERVRDWMMSMHTHWDIAPAYRHALYFAVVITTGVGWDIVPTTESQVAFTTAATVVGLVLFAIVVGSATATLSNYSSAESRTRARLEKVRAYMRFHSVPVELQRTVCAYLSYSWYESGSFLTSLEDLSKLPPKLEHELSLALNHRLIQSVPMLRDGSVPPAATSALLAQFRRRVYMPGEFIIQEGEVGTKLYVLYRGRVRVECNGRSVGEIPDGACFGEIAVLSRQQVTRTASCIADDYCDVLSLSRRNFYSVCRRFPGILEALNGTQGKGADNETNRRASFIEKVKRASFKRSKQLSRFTRLFDSVRKKPKSTRAVSMTLKRTQRRKKARVTAKSASAAASRAALKHGESNTSPSRQPAKLNAFEAALAQAREECGIAVPGAAGVEL